MNVTEAFAYINKVSEALKKDQLRIGESNVIKLSNVLEKNILNSRQKNNSDILTTNKIKHAKLKKSYPSVTLIYFKCVLISPVDI